MNKWEILSLGGSVFCPAGIDVQFLKKFKRLILKWVKKGKRFAILTGGGSLTREYQKIAKQLGVFKNDDLDWIGIYGTWLHAILIKTFFGGLAFSEIITNPTKKIKTEKKIIIGAGWKPGSSTDLDAVLLARNLGSKRIINLSNIDYVYDKDPKKFKDAKPVEKMTFEEIFKIVGKKWTPGANVPFDPIAAQIAQKEKIEIIILNGRNFDNLEKIFRGENFIGTIIREN